MPLHHLNASCNHHRVDVGASAIYDHTQERTVVHNNTFIDLEADSILLDQKTSSIKITGEVMLWFNNIVLNTKEIIIFCKTLSPMVMTRIDIPNKVRITNKESHETIVAEKATYLLKEKKVVLHEASCSKDGMVINAPCIVFISNLLTIQSLPRL
ncbi:hypothetical protein Sarmat_00108 [Rickettsiales endosymbiont of Paramecium tredecaurelia]|nr:hypothetical protein [Candidatus Sarmatiella mevalonica]